MSNIKHEEILKICIEHYRDYLKYWYPYLSNNDIQKDLNYFSEIFLYITKNNPYKFKVDHKEYMLIEIRDIFSRLKKETEPKRSHEILHKIIDACYSTDIKPKSAKTVLYLQYAPLMDLLVFVISVLFTIVFSLLK